MKGIDLSREYYEEYGKVMIRSRFSAYENRIAAGCVGPGSECFGYDDDISRDHDWGPGFCLWLVSEDYAAIGKDLQRSYDQLPKVFKGFGPRIASEGEAHRMGVSEIRSFYLRYTGLDHPPSGNSEWMRISEQALATATNGVIFSDPLGEFSAWREKLLQYYPEDIRLQKIASSCFLMAQAGQYNYGRSIRREEYFAADYSKAMFCYEAISLVYLLNRKYAPFYKWMHKGMRELPILGPSVSHMINDLLHLDLKNKSEKIESISVLFIDELRREGLSDSPSDFLLDHAFSVQSRIGDEKIRKHFQIVKNA